MQTSFTKYVRVFIISSLVSSIGIAANNHHHLKLTPPPIPPVNTPEFKNYVKAKHTFPSPFGFEAYRDQQGNSLKFLIKDINRIKPYIPVTFYCNAYTKCPTSVVVAYDEVMFRYSDNSYVSFGFYGQDDLHRALIGFYYPDDPRLYTAAIGFHQYPNSLLINYPIVTILFSLNTLQYLSEQVNGQRRGSIRTNQGQLMFPLSDGKEAIEVGTTLSLIGLGVASGVEFSETISQTTGESYSHQVQTGFSISVGFENDTTVGGGVVPVSDSFKVSVNSTLSQMVSNGLQIDNQQTTSRTYTIKPGINDTYYWGIYQLMYSYRINAPLLDTALQEVTRQWNNLIRCSLAANTFTEDNKPIGNPLPPQTSQGVNDVTVGVAVPVNTSQGDIKVFSEKTQASS